MDGEHLNQEDWPVFEQLAKDYRAEANPLVKIRIAQDLEDFTRLLLAQSISEARTAKKSWRDIGERLRISEEAAREKYGQSIGEEQ